MRIRSDDDVMAHAATARAAMVRAAGLDVRKVRANRADCHTLVNRGQLFSRCNVFSLRFATCRYTRRAGLALMASVSSNHSQSGGHSSVVKKAEQATAAQGQL